MKGNKKNSRGKTTLFFWLALVASGFAGELVGFFGHSYSGTWYEFFMGLRDGAVHYSPYFLMVLEIVIFAGCLSYYYHGKKLLKNWDKEDEETADLFEREEGIALAITSVGLILNIVTFGFIIADLGYDPQYANIYLRLGSCLIFVVASIGITFVQRMIVDLTKQACPEKNGDALDFNFQKKWIESCDEQERQRAYKAAYKAFASGNVLYSCILIVLLLGELLFKLGVTPIVVLGVIWLVQTVIYQRECLKK